VGLLAAGVAHEIHNPLATISMYAQMLKEKARDEAQSEKLQAILDHIDRISEITRGLLDFSRHSDGAVGPVDLHGTLEKTIRLAGPSISRQDIQVELQRCPEALSVRGEEMQLQQAFLNILMNASQAMPDGGTLRIGTRRLSGEGMAEVEFEDTGPGIDGKDLERVFDPFFTTKEPGEGTGLGLAVTYGIVQSHRGQIEIDSEPGKGTRVTIRLPLSEGGTS
jgi:signal transduction histidine kinase